MRLPWARRRVESSYTGYYAADNGYIMGPDPNYSAKFYISNNHIVGPRNSGRFFLSDPPVAGVRFVYDTHKPGAHLDYYLTATGHFYGPEQDLPWFRG
jgi:hypothetical protein